MVDRANKDNSTDTIDTVSTVLSTEAIWLDWSERLKRFILQKVRDEPAAEDILQEVFLKIHSHIGTLHDISKLKGWVYRIVRNAIADYYRNYYSAMRPTTEVPETLAAPEEEDDPARSLIPDVRAYVEGLPPDYRQALVLTEYEGLTQKEMAERLGISLSGAKSRVQRARAKIKEMLLDCCHFELDRHGRIMDYQARCRCCRAEGLPIR